MIHLPTKRKCVLIKEFVLKGDGKSITYLIAQVGKEFHYLVYPKEEYADLADTSDEPDSRMVRRGRTRLNHDQEG